MKEPKTYAPADMAMALIARFPAQVIDFWIDRPKPDVSRVLARCALAKFPPIDSANDPVSSWLR